MKIRVFVTGSAAFFAAWLMLTFVRQVPHEHYPRLGKGSLPVSAEAAPAPAAPVAGIPHDPATEIALAD
jgi:hypothetical protein